MSISLYELSQMYEEIMDLNVDDKTLEAMLFSLKDSIEEKTENICKVMAQMEGDEVTLDTEIKRLQAKKEALGTRRTKLKDYLSETLKTLGMSNIKGKLFNVSFRKSSSLKIDDENLIPEEYKQEVTSVQIDKNGIKKAMKVEEIPGCHIETNSSIQIK